MQAVLKALHSPTIFDLPNYRPENENSFAFLLQAIIGPKDEEGEESSDIEVCTPLWLQHHYNAVDIISGRHLLIVQRYNFKAIKAYIENYISKCNGKTWDEIAFKLSHLGHWEFEDCQR